MKFYLQNWAQAGSFFIMLYCALNKARGLIAKNRTGERQCLFTKETAKSNEIFLYNVEGTKIPGTCFTYLVCILSTELVIFNMFYKLFMLHTYICFTL